MSPVNLILAITWLTITGYTNAANAKFLEPISPLIYINSKNYVDEGLENVAVEVKMVSPCQSLNNSKLLEITEEQAISDAIGLCEEHYSTLIIKRIRELEELNKNLLAHPNARSKRQTTLFLTYLYFSDVTKTMIRNIFGNRDETTMRAHINSIEEQMAKFKNSLNTSLLLNDAIQNVLKQQALILKENSHRIAKLHQAVAASPKLSVATSYIMAKMITKSSLLAKIGYKLRHGVINMNAITEYLEDQTLAFVDESSTVPIGIYLKDGDTLRIEFVGRFMSTSTKHYKIKSFRI